MKLLILVVAICVLQVCYSKSTRAPNSNSSDTSQDDGIKPGDYPFHGILRLQSGDHFPVCEVVLIEKNWLLTTADCVHKYQSDPKSLQVLMGTTSTENSDSGKTAQTRTVTAIEISPKWESSRKESGDIALIKVGTPFKSNAFVKVADYGAEIVTDDIYEQISYGYTDELESTVVKAPSEEVCEETYYRSFNSTDRFCVVGQDGSYLFGDWCAGAPIAYVEKYEPIYLVYGITSSKSAGFATKISDHKEWIESLTRPGQPGRAIPQRKQTTTEIPQNSTDSGTESTDVSNTDTSTLPPTSTTTK